MLDGVVGSSTARGNLNFTVDRGVEIGVGIITKNLRLWKPRRFNGSGGKRIVQKAQSTGQGIAIEDLRHIRKRTEARLKKSQRSRHSSWSFGQLRQFLFYKAALAGVPLHLVDPRNTSRTCSVCGHCAKKEPQEPSLLLLCRVRTYR